MTAKIVPPVHPGEILLEEFLKPMEISQARLAKDTKIHIHTVGAIVHGRRAITPETALRLSRYFGTTPQFWLGLQADYDIDVTRKKRGKRILREVKVIPQ